MVTDMVQYGPSLKLLSTAKHFWQKSCEVAVGSCETWSETSFQSQSSANLHLWRKYPTLTPSRWTGYFAKKGSSV
ncbi:hypothetical protein NW763_013294 [Fusarium oxysporum]|nr:hypothetical protein NW763_013294 [Fusarium oxysporum]